jgi:hypothetical protein
MSLWEGISSRDLQGQYNSNSRLESPSHLQKLPHFGKS